MAMFTMTQQAEPTRRVVDGVDTRKDVHVGAVLDDNGRLVGTGSFASSTVGFRQLWRWMRAMAR
jgi:transposase